MSTTGQKPSQSRVEVPSPRSKIDILMTLGKLYHNGMKRDKIDSWHLPEGEKLTDLAVRVQGGKRTAARALILHCLGQAPMTWNVMKDEIPSLYDKLNRKVDIPLNHKPSPRTVRRARDELLEEGEIQKDASERQGKYQLARQCVCGEGVSQHRRRCPICGTRQEYTCPKCQGTVLLEDLLDDPTHCPICTQDVKFQVPVQGATDAMQPPRICPVQEEVADRLAQIDSLDDRTRTEWTHFLRTHQLVSRSKEFRTALDEAEHGRGPEAIVETVREVYEDLYKRG